MPVDRSLLPPLPGKPDWYVENAPQAVDVRALAEDVGHATPPAPAAMRAVVEPAPALVPEVSPLAAPPFPTAFTHPMDNVHHPGAHPGHGRRLGKVKALAGRFRT